VYDFHILEQMVKRRKNMSKITKQQEFTAKS
jgi:DNA-binding phage protein